MKTKKLSIIFTFIFAGLVCSILIFSSAYAETPNSIEKNDASTANEILRAIRTYDSSIKTDIDKNFPDVDASVEKFLQSIKSEIDSFESDLYQFVTDASDVSDDVSTLLNDASTLNQQISNLKENVQKGKADSQSLLEKIEEMYLLVDSQKAKFNELIKADTEKLAQLTQASEALQPKLDSLLTKLIDAYSEEQMSIQITRIIYSSKITDASRELNKKIEDAKQEKKLESDELKRVNDALTLMDTSTRDYLEEYQTKAVDVLNEKLMKKIRDYNKHYDIANNQIGSCDSTIKLVQTMVNNYKSRIDDIKNIDIPALQAFEKKFDALDSSDASIVEILENIENKINQDTQFFNENVPVLEQERDYIVNTTQQQTKNINQYKDSINLTCKKLDKLIEMSKNGSDKEDFDALKNEIENEFNSILNSIDADQNTIKEIKIKLLSFNSRAAEVNAKVLQNASASRALLRNEKSNIYDLRDNVSSFITKLIKAGFDSTESLILQKAYDLGVTTMQHESKCNVLNEKILDGQVKAFSPEEEEQLEQSLDNTSTELSSLKKEISVKQLDLQQVLYKPFAESTSSAQTSDKSIAFILLISLVICSLIILCAN